MNDVALTVRYACAKLMAYWLVVNYREAFRCTRSRVFDAAGTDCFAATGFCSTTKAHAGARRLSLGKSPWRSPTSHKGNKSVSCWCRVIVTSLTPCRETSIQNATGDTRATTSSACGACCSETPCLSSSQCLTTQPEDYVIATGTTRSVRDFAQAAFQAAGSIFFVFANDETGTLCRGRGRVWMRSAWIRYWDGGVDDQHGRTASYASAWTQGWVVMVMGMIQKGTFVRPRWTCCWGTRARRCGTLDGESEGEVE